MKELEIEMYLRSFEEGDNITVTCDLLKAMEEAIDVVKQQDKEYIALDLETRELRTESDKMVAEHLAFAELAKKADEQQKAEIERLEKRNGTLLYEKDAMEAQCVGFQKQVDELEEILAVFKSHLYVAPALIEMKIVSQEYANIHNVKYHNGIRIVNEKAIEKINKWYRKEIMGCKDGN